MSVVVAAGLATCVLAAVAGWAMERQRRLRLHGAIETATQVVAKMR